MKKILLGTLLLILLLAVSYFKVMREREGEAAARLEGMRVGKATIDRQAAEIDSLSGLIDSQETVLAESLAAHDQQRNEFTDTLHATITQLRHQVDSLKELQAKQAAAAKAAARPTRKSNGGAAHKDILAFYKRKIEALPADLSDYEKRVAVSEVRDETARKFNITVKRFNEIRELYNLDY